MQSINSYHSHQMPMNSKKYAMKHLTFWKILTFYFLTLFKIFNEINCKAFQMRIFSTRRNQNLEPRSWVSCSTPSFPSLATNNVPVEWLMLEVIVIYLRVRPTHTNRQNISVTLWDCNCSNQRQRRRSEMLQSLWRNIKSQIVMK